MWGRAARRSPLWGIGPPPGWIPALGRGDGGSGRAGNPVKIRAATPLTELVKIITVS